MRPAPLLLVFFSIAGATAFGDAIDNYVRSQIGPRRIPGVSLAVVKDGHIVKAAGYGVASLELPEAAAGAETVYEIGSISKLFTATAVLMLRDEGKLKLDDPLSAYIENTPEAWKRITLRHVLSHTAGLPDFDTGNIGFSYRREYTPAEFVSLMASPPLAYEPGEKWNYVNAFPLLGMVIERVTGKSYADFMRTRMFDPAGMASARIKSPEEVVPHRAGGYYHENGKYRQGEPLRPAVIAPNGGILMNVSDFARWDIALQSGKILSSQSLREMETPVRLNNGTTVAHGLGWFVDTFNGHRFGAHWGSTVTGHTAVIRRYAEGVTVIMLANLNDDVLGIDAMSKRVAGMYLTGTCIQDLQVRARDEDANGTLKIREALAEVAAGKDAPGVRPGLGAGLPAPVRARIGALAGPKAGKFEWLGDEAVGTYHFNLDPELVRLRRYRVRIAGASGEQLRFLTVRLSGNGTILGALVEDE
jgi:D-alanyl-D-alanine carboxypeptidase